MAMFYMFFFFNVGCVLQSVFATDYDLQLSSNSPVINGGKVQFKAQFYIDGHLADGSFKFYWEDNTLERNTRTTETTQPYDSWNITYYKNPPGPYEIQVTVYKHILFIYEALTSQRLFFRLTDELNGELKIIQDNKTADHYVSNTTAVVHQVSLKESDALYLKNSSKSVLAYWFIDCEYHGVTSDFAYTHYYNHTDVEHHVETLIVAGYEPITTTAAPTTSTTSSPTTVTTTTSTTPKSTTPPTTATATKLSNAIHKVEESASNSKVKRDVNFGIDTSNMAHEILVYSGSNLVSTHKQLNPESQFICNGSVIPTSTNNTFGYFSKSFTVKAPVSKLTITGNNWIRQGNILQLQLSCKGSKPFQYCLNYFPGIYNITGNETCLNPLPLDNCNFEISRYYGSPGSHTIVVVITNDVYKVVTPITVTVYEVTKQAQLSVIVVPVTFSIVAIVLIVFGVAYHLQNRSRFTVEVADFNFGPQYADYMTFRERLRDSIMNAFTRATVSAEETEGGPIWPPNQKYGSMPRF